MKLEQGYLRPNEEYELLLFINHGSCQGHIIQFLDEHQQIIEGQVLWLQTSISVSRDLVRVKKIKNRFGQQEFWFSRKLNL